MVLHGKLKITITGPKVHEVGYRIFLLTKAMDLGLPGFLAYNMPKGGEEQQVIAMARGDEFRIEQFKQYVQSNRPVLAQVSDISITDYDGDVGRTGEFAMFCSFVQMNKAVPILQTMVPIMQGMLEMQSRTLDEIKGLREAQGQMLEKQGQTLEEIKGLREVQDQMLEKQGQTLEEIKGLREDVRPGVSEQLRRVEVDIRAIKDRLGMP